VRQARPVTNSYGALNRNAIVTTFSDVFRDVRQMSTCCAASGMSILCLHCTDSPADGPGMERSEAGTASLFSETTAVQFDQLPEAAIRAYVETGAQ
jgi:hypothetical protein